MVCSPHRPQGLLALVPAPLSLVLPGSEGEVPMKWTIERKPFAPRGTCRVCGTAITSYDYVLTFWLRHYHRSCKLEKFFYRQRGVRR